MTHLTPEHVGNAYKVLAPATSVSIADYWDDDMVWLVPGHNQLSGWKYGRRGSWTSWPRSAS